jgi:hypothetical protein
LAATPERKVEIQRPKKGKPTPTQSNPGNRETTNNFKALEKEGESENPSKETQAEEEKYGQVADIGGTPKTTEEMEKPVSPPGNEEAQGIEEGEISLGNESEGASEAWDTPKKPGRGRKSKKVERDQETYKEVLKGAQPTIKQMIGVRQTKKLAKASQGGHSPPQSKQ